MRPKAGGQATELDGKYFYVYQRQGNGSWRIARDIYNNTMPPTSSPVEE
jgi:ketosteroid isomerase-like protein